MLVCRKDSGSTGKTIKGVCFYWEGKEVSDNKLKIYFDRIMSALKYDNAALEQKIEKLEGELRVAQASLALSENSLNNALSKMNKS